MNNHQHEELVTENPGTEALLEQALKGFWERARSAAELITQLRKERLALRDQVRTLEQEASSLRAQLGGREQDLKRLKAENAQLLSSATSGRDVFTAEEREVLKDRIKVLIAKINSHL